MMFLCLCTAALVALANGQCPGQADVVIAVPGGRDISDDEFGVFENQLIQLLNYWNIDRTQINVGLVIYGRSPKVVARLHPFKNRLQLNTRVTLLKRRGLYQDALIGGGNDVAAAMDQVTKMLTEPSPGYDRSTMRPQAAKIGMIFQYGAAKTEAERNAIRDASSRVRRHRIMMYGVNANGSGPEFQFMTFDACRQMQMQSFNTSLDEHIPKIGSSVCAELDPNVRVWWHNCLPRTYNPVPTKAPPLCFIDGQLLPDSNNCGYYYQCSNGQPERLECSDDTLFDSTPGVGVCNFIEDVACYANNDMRCPFSDGVFPHPTHCRKYLNCYKYKPHVSECQPSEWFDASTGSCVGKALTSCPYPKVQ